VKRFRRVHRLDILLVVLSFAVAGWMAQALLVAPAVSAAPGFTDLSGQEWYAEAALALEDQGVISPRPDGSFGPHDFVSRGEMAVYLDRLLNLQGDPSLPFTDVNVYDWYAGAVGDLYAAGLVSGTSADTFSPDALVNRQQAASFIMRALEFSRASRPDLAGIDLLPEETQPWLAGFRDRSLIGPQHKSAIAGAYKLGIVQGDTNG
jgi:S-layer homology domain